MGDVNAVVLISVKVPKPANTTQNSIPLPCTLCRHLPHSHTAPPPSHTLLSLSLPSHTVHPHPPSPLPLTHCSPSASPSPLHTAHPPLTLPLPSPSFSPSPVHTAHPHPHLMKLSLQQYASSSGRTNMAVVALPPSRTCGHRTHLQPTAQAPSIR